MSRKPIGVGKELVERLKNLNKNIESIMGKVAKPKSESLSVSNGLVMYLYDAGDNKKKHIRVDFYDNYYGDEFRMILDRAKLQEVADFINKYLEQN